MSVLCIVNKYYWRGTCKYSIYEGVQVVRIGLLISETFALAPSGGVALIRATHQAKRLLGEVSCLIKKRQKMAKILKVNLLLGLLCVLTFPTSGQALECSRLLGAPLKIVTGVYYTSKTEESFSIVDRENRHISFSGYLNSKGVLSISAHLVFPGLGHRSSLRGDALYKEMIEHFGLAQIKEIRGIWVDGVNFKKFFTLRESGASLAQAALNTWSGKQAVKYGFTEVKSIEVDRDAMTGTTSILVSFI